MNNFVKAYYIPNEEGALLFVKEHTVRRHESIFLFACGTDLCTLGVYFVGILGGALPWINSQRNRAVDQEEESKGA